MLAWKKAVKVIRDQTFLIKTVLPLQGGLVQSLVGEVLHVTWCSQKKKVIKNHDVFLKLSSRNYLLYRACYRAYLSYRASRNYLLYCPIFLIEKSNVPLHKSWSCILFEDFPRTTHLLILVSSSLGLMVNRLLKKV